MDVAAGARGVRRELGHEGDTDALLVSYFLEALLVDCMAVGHGEHIGIAHVQFVLAAPPLALGVLHGDT